MIAPLSPEELRAMDVLQIADLIIFVENVLNDSVAVSCTEHGAPDCFVHVPPIAEKIATSLDCNLSSIKPEDRQRWFSEDSFRMVNSIIYRYLVDNEIVSHESFRGLSHMTNVWAGNVLRELVHIQQWKACSN